MDEVRNKVRNVTRRLNKSMYFLLPMLNMIYFNEQRYLVNTFIGDKLNRPKLDNYHIFLLSNNEVPKLENHQNFIESYKVDEGLMYVFRVPVEYEEDYLRFILGEYSKFSAEYKQLIMKLLPAPIERSTIFKVITKAASAKKEIEARIGQSIGDQEVFSIPNYEEEIYE